MKKTKKQIILFLVLTFVLSWAFMFGMCAKRTPIQELVICLRSQDFMWAYSICC